MNPRIQQLKQQAGIDFNPDQEGLNLFAELIIRECLTVINQSNGVGDDDVIRISDDVKEHFGVEE
jgi:hypothetical protein